MAEDVERWGWATEDYERSVALWFRIKGAERLPRLGSSERR